MKLFYLFKNIVLSSKHYIALARNWTGVSWLAGENSELQMLKSKTESELESIFAKYESLSLQTGSLRKVLQDVVQSHAACIIHLPVCPPGKL